MPAVEMNEHEIQCHKEIHRLRARVKELEEALAPFAKIGLVRAITINPETEWQFWFTGKEFAKAAACMANGKT